MALKDNKETRLQKRVQAYIESLGGYCFKVHGSAYMKAGIPDIVACLEGRFVGIECKVDKNKPSELQLAHGRLIEKAGGVFMVIYSLEEVKENLYYEGFTVDY